MSDAIVISVPGRALVGALLVLVAALVVVPGPRDALTAVAVPRTVADPATLERQRTAAEDSIGVGYTRAIEQLRQVRQLTLAIGSVEADAIEGQARADLAAVRREALAAIGRLAGVPQLESYVAAAQVRLDQAQLGAGPGVLLAPSLFAVVARADELFAQVADGATRQLTGSPSPSPSASP